MGIGNCLFCAGKRGIGCTWTGIHWRKKNNTKMGMGLRFEQDSHWDYGIYMGFRQWEIGRDPPLPFRPLFPGTPVPVFFACVQV